MKKNIIGLSALLIAVACFAFTNANSVKSDNCSQSVYWFYVTSSTFTTSCGSVALVYPTSVPTQEQHASGCDAGTDIICSLGFPNYVNVGTQQNPIYHPADGSGTEITNLCNYTCIAYKTDPR